jgi:hypothetical protein
VSMRVVLIAALTTAAAYAQDASLLEAGRISGYVMSADTGRPVSGAVVRLSLRKGGTPAESTTRTTTADASGAFVFSHLPAGAFTLAASGPRYLAWSYGQRRSGQAAPIHVLRYGQQLEVEIALPKQSAISGRVVDQFGDPVPGVGVFLFKEQDVDGVSRVQPLSMRETPQSTRAHRLTDDLGQFRLHGLAPGEYYLGALTGALTASPLYNTPNGIAGFAPTYAPGAPTIAEAGRITLVPSQELNDITIAVVPSPMRRVSGVVTDSTGRPLSRALMSLTPLDPESSGAAIAGRSQAREDGTFIFTDVPPGVYVLQGRSLGTTDAFNGEYGWTTITVAKTDLAGVSVTTSGPSSFKGRFVFTGVDEVVLKRIFSIQIAVPAVELDKEPVIPISTTDPAAKLDSESTFEVEHLWGRRLIRLRRAPAGWRLERVIVDGKDATDVPIDFTGRSYTGAEIVLTSQTAAVKGFVVDGAGRRVFDGRVVVFAADSSRWTLHSRFVEVANVSADGAFAIDGLPPGEYLAVVVPTDVVSPKSASFLHAARGSALPLSLDEKETKSIELIAR